MQESTSSQSPLPPPADSLEHRVAAAFRELRRAGRRFREHLAETGDEPLDAGQLDILELLMEREAWRMSELASALRVDASTATRAVDRLASAGLARRSPAEADRRGVVVEATDEGRRRLRAAVALRRELMDGVLAAFTTREREVLARMLERLVEAMDQATRGA
ncbi:MAG: MarR family winged helix-turn-helix transcriptional regulator [Actinomycetota bacterium]